MKECERCGNDIPDSSTRCRFCCSEQRLRAHTSRQCTRVRTVNIEEGLPSVQESLARLEEALLRAKHAGVLVVRVIHGYGSSGAGGRLRDACRACLRQKVAARQIKGFLPGEEYSGTSSAGRALMRRFPDLPRSERTDSRNPGITFVEL